MYNRKKLVKQLYRDVESLEKKLEHRTLYNIRNGVVKSLLKSGIAIDFAFPVVLSAMVLGHAYSLEGNPPFHIDEIKEKAKIETIDTSSGIHLKNISCDFNDNQQRIEYSTGWIHNDRGLYERTVTSYRISNEIDLSETDKILSMSKEEIEDILVVTNIQTICKNVLTAEDQIYHSEALIIVNYSESENETVTRLESVVENIVYSLWFIATCWTCRNLVRKIENIFIKTSFQDILRRYEPFVRQMHKDDLNTMKEILEIRKQNLDMIEGMTNNNGESPTCPYSLGTEQLGNREDRPYMLRRV